MPAAAPLTVPSVAPAAAAVVFAPLPPGATALLEERLGSAQLELRKLGSERHSLQARLRREVDRVRELESALRAEAELRRQASDEHQAALAGLRARLGSLEVSEAQQRELEGRLSEATASLAALGLQLTTLAQERDQAISVMKPAAPARASKVVEGLRRISGIGPGYQRALESLGVTRIEQVAEWTPDDIQLFADSLKIRPERISKEDWIGQAKRLSGGVAAVPD